MQASLPQEVSNTTEFGLQDVLWKWLQKCIYAMQKKKKARRVTMNDHQALALSKASSTRHTHPADAVNLCEKLQKNTHLCNTLKKYLLPSV